MENKEFVVPFKGKHPVAVTQRAWLEELVRDEGLSLDAGCWCGDTPGMCVDCREDQVMSMMGKVNIGSGEDGNAFR